ncbi:MAG: hypothetical protein QM675_12355 [Protaetiibacter sp.]
MRVVVSLVIALVGSLAGTLLVWYGGGHTVLTLGTAAATDAAVPFLLLTGLGGLLLAAAAASVRWSPVGAIVAGAGHLVFSLPAFLVPFAPFESAASPSVKLLNSLYDVDSALATGGYYFVAFGGGLLVGAALLAAGIASRRRPTVTWRVLSAVGGVLAIAAGCWAFALGGDFYRLAVQVGDWQLATAVAPVVAALVFGVLLAPSGRSAIGAWIAGGVLALGGVVLLVAEPVAFVGAPGALLVTLPVLGWSGTVLVVGLSLLGLALGVMLRPAPPVEPVPAPV